MSGPTKTQLEAIAYSLAWRMRAHAFCDAHPATKPEMDCPFCADRTVLALYEDLCGPLEKSALDRLTDSSDTISIFDVLKQLRS